MASSKSVKKASQKAGTKKAVKAPAAAKTVKTKKKNVGKAVVKPSAKRASAARGAPKKAVSGKAKPAAAAKPEKAKAAKKKAVAIVKPAAKIASDEKKSAPRKIAAKAVKKVATQAETQKAKAHRTKSQRLRMQRVKATRGKAVRPSPASRAVKPRKAAKPAAKPPVEVEKPAGGATAAPEARIGARRIGEPRPELVAEPQPYIDHGPLLPDSYGGNRLAALARDPSRIYAYWEIEGLDKLAAKAARWALRIITGSGESYDVEIDPAARNWYMPAKGAETYDVRIGYFDAEGGFHIIAAAKRMRTPRGHRVPRTRAQWVDALAAEPGRPIPLVSESPYAMPSPQFRRMQARMRRALPIGYGITSFGKRAKN